MSQQSISENAPGTDLFPEYATLYDLIAPEVEGLSDEQLDFSSDQWEWSKWSIRTQLSHMASLLYRWMLLRWGDTLFPDGEHGVEDVKGLAQSASDRRMDDSRYWELPSIMEKLKEGIDLVRQVLAERDIGFLRSQTYPRLDWSPMWDVAIKAHPSGITRSDDAEKGAMTLEASVRHMYFEETTHLFNIQRLKRAQGLPTVVDVPRVGYWAVEGWDISEANGTSQ